MISFSMRSCSLVCISVVVCLSELAAFFLSTIVLSCDHCFTLVRLVSGDDH